MRLIPLFHSHGALSALRLDAKKAVPSNIDVIRLGEVHTGHVLAFHLHYYFNCLSIYLCIRWMFLATVSCHECHIFKILIVIVEECINQPLNCHFEIKC